MASPDAPCEIAIERVTPAIQGVDFDNLARFDPSMHERVWTRTRCAAELRKRQIRTVTAFSASGLVIDFRPRSMWADTRSGR
ncbi:hypothetical protein ACU4GH_04505 [Bradyrhizobium betae]